MYFLLLAVLSSISITIYILPRSRNLRDPLIRENAEVFRQSERGQSPLDHLIAQRGKNRTISGTNVMSSKVRSKGMRNGMVALTIRSKEMSPILAIT